MKAPLLPCAAVRKRDGLLLCRENPADVLAQKGVSLILPEMAFKPLCGLAKCNLYFNSQSRFNVSTGVRDVLLAVKIAQTTGEMINTHYQSLAMFPYFCRNIQKNKIACSVLLLQLFLSTH